MGAFYDNHLYEFIIIVVILLLIISFLVVKFTKKINTSEEEIEDELFKEKIEKESTKEIEEIINEKHEIVEPVQFAKKLYTAEKQQIKEMKMYNRILELKLDRAKMENEIKKLNTDEKTLFEQLKLDINRYINLISVNIDEANKYTSKDLEDEDIKEERDFYIREAKKYLRYVKEINKITKEFEDLSITFENE